MQGLSNQNKSETMPFLNTQVCRTERLLHISEFQYKYEGKLDIKSLNFHLENSNMWTIKSHTNSPFTSMPMERAVPMMDLHMDSSDMYWQSESACLILAISYTCFGGTTPATLWPASPPPDCMEFLELRSNGFLVGAKHIVDVRSILESGGRKSKENQRRWRGKEIKP